MKQQIGQIQSELNGALHEVERGKSALAASVNQLQKHRVKIQSYKELLRNSKKALQETTKRVATLEKAIAEREAKCTESDGKLEKMRARFEEQQAAFDAVTLKKFELEERCKALTLSAEQSEPVSASVDLSTTQQV